MTITKVPPDSDDQPSGYFVEYPADGSQPFKLKSSGQLRRGGLDGSVEEVDVDRLGEIELRVVQDLHVPYVCR